MTTAWSRETLHDALYGGADLAAIYAEHKGEPPVKASRRRWARLLLTALGEPFEDNDELFIAHTLIVTSAEIIAHAVSGLDVERLVPAALLSGEELDKRGIHGVIEADLFDWIIHLPEGDAFTRALARRLARFSFGAVDHDVLKVLYESVIPAETRKRLGEYYTPDWLARQIVDASVTAPLEDRVLDPACGSGTFLFHAVRRYCAEAESRGTPVATMLHDVTSHVSGIDLHPVAVALAKVTYLLAIGRERLSNEARGALHVPVYLGDSMQWRGSAEVLDGPAWRSRLENRVDVLVGNPPWLPYRFMPSDIQMDFRAMSEARGLWKGASVATQQDLSGLFVARMVQIYLRPGGRFGFVMPDAVLDRDQFAGFRAGNYDEGGASVRVSFTRPWDLRRLRPHFFPRGAAVVFGERGSTPRPMPEVAEVWSGRLPSAITRRVAASDTKERDAGSPYRDRFRNGASIFPRLFFMVEKKEPGLLGQAAGRAEIRSIRSAYEKKPWKDLPDLEGSVETEFLRAVHLGETVLPYRVLSPALAVIPRGDDDRIDRPPGLADWWRRAEQCWEKHRSSERLTLFGRLNFHGELSNQLAIRPERVVYTKSGMHLSAARLADRGAVVDHTLYWAAASSVAEARYLSAILNSGVITRLVRPLMAYGKDERHIDKHIWRLPIPMFDRGEELHAELSALGQAAEEAVAGLTLDDEPHFSAARRRIRRFLEESEIGKQIEALVKKLTKSARG